MKFFAPSNSSGAGLFVGFASWVLIRRLAPLKTRYVSFYSVLGGIALGSMFLRILCGASSAEHFLLFHYLPALIGFGGGLIAMRYTLDRVSLPDSKESKDQKLEEMKSLFSHPNVRSWLSIVKGYRTIYSHLESHISQYGCSMSRFQILLYFYFKGALAPVQIARQMHVSRPNITNFLKRLVEDGLVQAIEDPEGKSKRPRYRLTREGEKYFEKIFPLHIAEIQTSVAELPESVIEVLLSLGDNLEPGAKSIIEEI